MTKKYRNNNKNSNWEQILYLKSYKNTSKSIKELHSMPFDLCWYRANNNVHLLKSRNMNQKKSQKERKESEKRHIQ